MLTPDSTSMEAKKRCLQSRCSLPSRASKLDQSETKGVTTEIKTHALPHDEALQSSVQMVRTFCRCLAWMKHSLFGYSTVAFSKKSSSEEILLRSPFVLWRTYDFEGRTSLLHSSETTFFCIGQTIFASQF
jgi:hypothetical protein